MSIRIRTEQQGEYEAVGALNYDAFGGRDSEQLLVERIRSSEGFIPELSLVAEENGEIVGHCLISKADIYDGHESIPTLVLAPIGVKPDRQRQGIGGKLIQEGLERAAKLGYGLVFLIGHPSYYPRFGFRPAGEFGLVLMQFVVPDDVFMVRELKVGELERLRSERNERYGELKYPQTFFA